MHRSMRRPGRWVLLPVASALLGASPARAQGPDHETFTALLVAHVDERGLVDYDAFAAAPSFDAYLEELDRTDPYALPDADRLALWINAYNAWTIRLINKHGERRSIRNINRTLGFIRAGRAWKERLARVGGQVYTLDEIEHEIIRREFDEPRIHFALVCAAMGCPPLRREAYRGDRLDRQLDDQARTFFTAHPDRNRVDLATGEVTLSPILDWYREDFPATDRELGRYLAPWFESPARELLESGGFRIRFSDYDWSLNAQGR